MWLENKIFREDMAQTTSAEWLPWERLKDKSILITGATGLIGYYLVSTLVLRNIEHGNRIRIRALVRDEERARRQFADALAMDGNGLEFVVGDLEHIPVVEGPVDYIIHGGSPTASRFFAEKPVETVIMNMSGITSLLEMAKAKKVQGFTYLSSMEVYGSVTTTEKVDEQHACFMDSMSPRSSYPEVKRLIENLCADYHSEYQVPANVIRLTQTFGPGFRDSDNRVWAQFIRSGLKHEPIILKTLGLTSRSYLYLADAVTAILTVLLLGKPGEAYNAANETSLCTIRDMAELVAEVAPEGPNGEKSEVRIEQDPDAGKIYPPDKHMDLDTTKLTKLGWRPKTDLCNMYIRTIDSIG